MQMTLTQKVQKNFKGWEGVNAKEMSMPSKSGHADHDLYT